MTDQDLLALALRIVRYEVAIDMVEGLTEDEARRLLSYVLYELRRRGLPSQRRAGQLFKSWLTTAQADELRRREHVTVTGSMGGVYRIRPRAGVTERVERHGRNWYRIATYCYHDAEGELPAGDIALAHLLILSTDEARFLAEANETKHWPQCWDSEYMTRRAEIRRRGQRAEAA
jgi:hypothetical protein